jgi:hypothetical protein
MKMWVYCPQLDNIGQMDVVFHKNDVESWYADVKDGTPIDPFWVMPTVHQLIDRVYQYRCGSPEKDIKHKINLKYFLNQLTKLS